jgi:hypothetical protein
MLLCTGTANASTTTFTDTLNLNHEQSILVNRQGIFSGGTAANLERIVRVSANVKSTQTLTFTPEAAEATAIGDELELWNERDEGVTPAAIGELINDAILDLGEHAPVPVTSDAFTFSANAPEIDIDELEVGEVVDGTNWEIITGVEWKPADTSDTVFAWVRVDSPDFHVDRHARTVTIRGQHLWLCDSMQMRVKGANIPGILEADTDTTAVNFEWLTHQVAAQALGLRLEKAFDRRDVEGRLLQLQQRADNLRGRVNLRLKGRIWRLS